MAYLNSIAKKDNTQTAVFQKHFKDLKTANEQVRQGRVGYQLHYYKRLLKNNKQVDQLYRSSDVRYLKLN